MIGRAAFVEAVRTRGLLLDTLQFKDTVHVEGSTDLEAARGADVVLFCVKTTDTESTARSLAPLLSPAATVVSLQNGVDNADKIRAAGINALSAVVYVAASVPQPAHIKHVGRGDLVVGPRNPHTEKFAALFERAQVAVRISDNIDGELWNKLIWNCALNAISALGRGAIRTNRRERRRAKNCRRCRKRGARRRGRRARSNCPAWKLRKPDSQAL